MRKTCSKCSIEKEYSEFIKDSRCKGGVSGTCRECANAYNKQYRADNPDKVKEYRKNSYENNKEYYAQKNRVFRTQNIEYFKNKSKNYYKMHAENQSKGNRYARQQQIYEQPF